MASCGVCKAESSLYICYRHIEYLKDSLSEIPWLINQLEVTVTRQDKLHQAPRTGGVHASPVNFGASRLLDEVHDLLIDWTSKLTDENKLRFFPAHSVGTNFIGPLLVGWQRLPRGYSGSPTQRARWIGYHISTLAGRKDAGDFYSSIIDLTGDPDHPSTPGRLVREINRKDRLFVGPCPTVRGHGQDGSEIHCNVTLWADEGVIEVTCPRCDATVDVAKNRMRAATERDLLPERKVVEVCDAMDEPISRTSLGNWVDLGLLHIHGWLHNGEVTPHKVRSTDPRVLSLSQVRAVRAQRLAAVS